MGRKSTLTADQKASIRYYFGQGEGPSGIASYTGIPPYKVGSYLRSLERDRSRKDVPETAATMGQREGQLPRGRGTKLADNEAAAMDRAIASGRYSRPADVARDFNVSYQTARRHWNRVKAQPEIAAPAPSYLPPPEPALKPPGKQGGLSPTETAHIDRLWRAGVRTITGLSRATGLSERTVHNYMDERGWKSEWHGGVQRVEDNLPAQPPMLLDNLTRAIINSTNENSRGGMEKEAAEQLAQHVLNFFGYSERIIDNILEPEDRDLFYNLEDSGILTTEREETHLYDGREWRIHYWMFRRERVAELSAPESPVQTEQREADELYADEVPDEVWRSHGTEPVEGIHVAPGLAAANVGARGAGTMSTN